MVVAPLRTLSVLLLALICGFANTTGLVAYGHDYYVYESWFNDSGIEFEPAFEFLGDIFRYLGFDYSAFRFFVAFSGVIIKYLFFTRYGGKFSFIGYMFFFVMLYEFLVLRSSLAISAIMLFLICFGKVGVLGTLFSFSFHYSAGAVYGARLLGYLSWFVRKRIILFSLAGLSLGLAFQYFQFFFTDRLLNYENFDIYFNYRNLVLIVLTLAWCFLFRFRVTAIHSLVFIFSYLALITFDMNLISVRFFDYALMFLLCFLRLNTKIQSGFVFLIFAVKLVFHRI